MEGPKYRNALKGINEEQEALKSNTDAYFTQTVVEFGTKNSSIPATGKLGTRGITWMDTQVTDTVTQSWMTPINGCEPITGRGANGNTPLYQVVGETLEKLRKFKKPEDKVLVKIFTDGEENASQGPFASAAVLKELIAQCEKEGFTVTFVGTQGDVEKVIADVRIDRSNTKFHMNTPDSINEVYRGMSTSTAMYSSKVLSGQDVTMDFFSPENPEFKHVDE